MPEVEYVRVSDAEDGMKLFSFLQRRFRDVPRQALMRIIRRGELRIDGKRAKPFDRLAKDQLLRLPPVRPADNRPNEPVSRISGRKPPEPRIIHEDEDILVIAKPPGLAAHPGTATPEAVTTWIGRRYPSASFRPAPAHRLDKHTSGLMLVAKTYAMLNYLHGLFRERDIRKQYLAWVGGDFPDGVVEDESFLLKTVKNGREIWARTAERPGAVKARAVFEKIGRSGGFSLIAAELLSGRTHQLRVQLAAMGHPIIGDVKYGGTPNSGLMLLHAWRLSFADRDGGLKREFRHLPDWPEPFGIPQEAVSRILSCNV